MTFPEICRHFQAKRIGKGKYQAKCPAHRDRSPSLSIREGQKAAMIKCWAGCDLEAVLRSSNIGLKDLWYQQDQDPAAVRKAQRDRDKAEALDDLVRECRRTLHYRRQMWVRVATAIAYLVMKNPDNKTLAAAYERALDCSGGELTTWPNLVPHCPYSPFLSTKLLSGISAKDVTPQIARLLKLKH